jgi:hypothetical protein
VLEDDITPDLHSLWSKPLLSEIIESYPHFSAIQLSALALPDAWNKFQSEVGNTVQLYEKVWVPSNGAYILSLAGAIAIRNAFIDYVSLKFDLSSLLCVNVDCCLMPLLSNTVLRMPPLFLHVKAIYGMQQNTIQDNDDLCEDFTESHELGGSTISCSVVPFRQFQKDLLNVSTRHAIDMSQRIWYATHINPLQELEFDAY